MLSFFGVFLPRAICVLLCFLFKNRCFYPVRIFSLFQSWKNAIFVKHDDWDWSDPRTIVGVPSPSSFGEPPTAARQRVFSLVASLLSTSHTWESRVWSAVAGAQRGPDSLFAPQSSCPGSSRRQGSHLPYTSVGLLRKPEVRRNTYGEKKNGRFCVKPFCGHART